jgi:hypothetical protein
MPLTTPRGHTHVQTEPAAEWLITHNLGGVPVVDVYIDDGEGDIEKILPSMVEIVNPMTCRITFSVPRAGQARIVA